MKKEKVKMRMIQFAIFGFILMVFNWIIMIKFGTYPAMYPPTIAEIFVIIQTIIYIDGIVVFIFLMKYLSALKNEKKN